MNYFSKYSWMTQKNKRFWYHFELPLTIFKYRMLALNWLHRNNSLNATGSRVWPILATTTCAALNWQATMHWPQKIGRNYIFFFLNFLINILFLTQNTMKDKKKRNKYRAKGKVMEIAGGFLSFTMSDGCNCKWRDETLKHKRILPKASPRECQFSFGQLRAKYHFAAISQRGAAWTVKRACNAHTHIHNHALISIRPAAVYIIPSRFRICIAMLLWCYLAKLHAAPCNEWNSIRFANTDRYF